MNDDWMKPQPSMATAQQAYDELHRELCVRSRCFPRWIREGRLSRSDAIDRLNRQALALELLGKVPGVTVNGTDESTGS